MARADPARRTPGDRPLARRDLLRATAVLLPVAVVSGCDLRLEDDAPPLPILQRKSVPDEAVLVDAVRRTSALAQTAGRVASPSDAVTRLAALHGTQSEVLRARLTAQGVPNHVIDTPSPTTSAAGTAAVSAPPPAALPELVAAEQAILGALVAALPGVTTDNRAVLASVAAACGAAVEVLGAQPAWPAADPLPPPAAVPLLDGTRAAEYAFQVVAAQTSGEVRARALATHTDLGRRETDLLAMAGSSAPAPPLGYALPFPVTGADAAGRLATQVLGTLVAGGLAPEGTLPEGSSSVVTLVRLLVDAQRLGRGWGVPSAAFPGQAYP